MTWGMVAVAGSQVVGGLVSSQNAKDAAKDAASSSARATEQAARLNQERLDAATNYLSPYIGSERVAHRQLAAELGLGDQLFESEVGGYANRISDLERQIQYLRDNPTKEVGQKRKGGIFSSSLAGRLIGSGGGLGALIGGVGGSKTKYATDAEAIADLELQLERERSELNKLQTGPRAQAGAYMRTPAYQAAIDAGVSAVDQAAANAGNLYSGSRGIALRDVGQGVNQSFFTNYMNLLQNMAAPTSTTNISNLGLGQAAQHGQNLISSAANQNAYNIAGTAAQNAAISDIAGGVGSVASAYFNRPNMNPSPQPPRNSGTMINPKDYSGHV